ncbi:MAG TPA: plastocyanin/azurin family copper-binding protein [Actinomycetota bacterium]|jgi:plastocyanin|nr:plastocyanin/azurin family copper-binding protein [Actinomycetota bacterium]
MRKVLLCLALLAAGCGREMSGSRIYQVDIDVPSEGGRKLQVSAFFPGRLRVSAGDTITFTNRSTEAPHTITFGVAPDRSNQPKLLTQDGENPSAFGKCYGKGKPKPSLTTCASKTLPAYNGTGYWNSGLLQPASAPDPAGPKSVSVKIAERTPKGEYAFVCVLHPFMNGTLSVGIAEDSPSSPEDVTAEGAADAQSALAAARALERPRLFVHGNAVTVSAGWGDRVISVNRFAPARVVVRVGMTVEWVTQSLYEPHTVTFASPYTRTADPKSFRPSGRKSGSSYSGGLANSGLLGPPGGPFPSGPFTLKFTKAREYRYVCTLHPGMNGVVVVR